MNDSLSDGVGTCRHCNSRIVRITYPDGSSKWAHQEEGTVASLTMSWYCKTTVASPRVDSPLSAQGSNPNVAAAITADHHAGVCTPNGTCSCPKPSELMGALSEVYTYPECASHKEVQHRDRKPPWCNSCGWNRGVPEVPPFKYGEPRDTKITVHQ